jgi:outer membrane immunogenic protein
MNRLIAATATVIVMATAAASAADLPRKAPLVAPAPTWNGLYAGVQGGYGGSIADVDAAANGVALIAGADALAAALANAVPTSFATNAKGFIGGGTLGYNVQTGQFVWGVETDLSWADIKGSNTRSGFAPAPFLVNTVSASTGTVDQKLDAFGTLRGRLGFAPDNRLLIYGTGGLALGHVDSHTNISTTLVPLPAALSISNAVGSESQFRVGWTAGAGAEFALDPRWSIKAEYLYYDLGTLTYSSGPAVVTVITPPPATPEASIGVKSSAEFKGSIVRAGINYKF